MADGRARAAVCVREERTGLVYIVAESRLGVGDVSPVTGAHAVWAAMLSDVRLPRRPMARGGQCTDECGLATWHSPNGRERHAQEDASTAR
jgi:hypothetical protein